MEIANGMAQIRQTQFRGVIFRETSLSEYSSIQYLQRIVSIGKSSRLIHILALQHADPSLTIPLAIDDVPERLLPYRKIYSDAFALPLLEALVSPEDGNHPSIGTPRALVLSNTGEGLAITPNASVPIYNAPRPPFRAGLMTWFIAVLGAISIAFVSLWSAVGLTMMAFMAGYALETGSDAAIRTRRYFRNPKHMVLLTETLLVVRQPSANVDLPLKHIVSATVTDDGHAAPYLRVMTPDNCVDLFIGLPRDDLQWLRQTIAAAAAQAIDW